MLPKCRFGAGPQKQGSTFGVRIGPFFGHFFDHFFGQKMGQKMGQKSGQKSTFRRSDLTLGSSVGF